MIQVVLVDENDTEVGLEEKVKAHLGDGILHRAFTVIIVNKNGDILVVQRSAEKMLWPLVWDSACASHPVKNENIIDAGRRRLVEELGFTCNLQLADIFQYKKKYLDIGCEHEVCSTLVGVYDGEVSLNSEEATDYKWIPVNKLKTDMKSNPENYTKWFKIALDRIIEQGRIIHS